MKTDDPAISEALAPMRAALKGLLVTAGLVTNRIDIATDDDVVVPTDGG